MTMVGRWVGAVAAAATSVLLACGGGPSGPGPVTPPPGGGVEPPPPNQPPRIESITLQKDRIEVDEEITITAAVSDTETPVDQLKFEWKADAGTFSGEGATVKWRVPAGAATPRDDMIRLTLVEPYGTAVNGVRPEHRIEGEAGPVRVHDSVKELSDLAMAFLQDFTTSSVPAETCVREFSDSCRGKFEELEQIRDNRTHFDIIGSRYNVQSVSLRPNAQVLARCEFTSRIKKCPAEQPNCRIGEVGTVRGDCLLTAVYEQKRWWLCESNFLNGVASPAHFRAFFRQR